MKQLICIIVTFLLIGCTSTTDNPSVKNPSTVNQKNQISFSQATESFTIEEDSIIEDGQEIRVAKIYDHLYSDTRSKNLKIIRKQINEQLDENHVFGLVGIYNQDFLIGYSYVDDADSIDDSIGLFDIASNVYKPLIEFKDSLEVGIYYYDQELIIYKTYHKNEMVELHVFDARSKKDKLIFEYYVDPDTNRPIYDNFNDLVILDNKIYFDDFVALESSNEITTILYSYDMETDILTEIDSDLQNPFILNGEIAAFGRNEKGNFKNLYSISSGSLIFEIKDDIRDFVVVGEKIYAIVNSDTNHEELYTVFSLKELISGKTILSSKSPLYNLKSSGGIIYWDNYYESEFVYYNSNTDQIVLCENTGKHQNITYTSESMNLLVCLKDDLPAEYILFNTFNQ